MDIKQIQELIKFVAKSGVNEVSIEREEFKITIKTNQAPTFVTANVPTGLASQAIAAPQSLNTIPSESAMETPKSEESEKTAELANLITVKSPMIGTFYRSSNPEKPFFVNVGDMVEVGQVVCIIEAMKLFNEIESEVSGRIVKVLAENAHPVEYDQPLFLVEPA